MEQKTNQNELLLVTGSSYTQKTLADQLKGFLPDEISIVPFCVNEAENPPLSGGYFVLFSSTEVYTKFLSRHLSQHIDEYIIGTRTIINDKLELILSLPREQDILLVTDSKAMAKEAVFNLKDIGFDFLRFIPYYPGCKYPYRPDSIAVTTGDLDQVPPGLGQVYNIGARPFDLTTVVRIMARYNILEDKIQVYAQSYLDTILAFARNLSNVADEASKVMKTVRTTLIGTGYYAKYHFNDIIGRSPSILKVKDAAAKVARTDLSVLIEGDNGTGKELLASAIHNYSNRRNKPFVAINFSALPDQLIESELFGYEDGAFTGAKKGGKIGLFQQAEGGTIFLDEIGDISPKMQTKLLRVLQEKEIMKVGGNRIIPIDVRIIAATNRHLKQMIEERTFRKDLYYRLKEGYLYLPSLSQRKEDIPLLVNHWMETLFHSRKEIHPDAMENLMQQDWPGNIRELLNVMKFTLAVSEKNVITVEDLPYDRPDTWETEEAVREPEPGLDDISAVILSAIQRIHLQGEIAGRSRIYAYLQSCGTDLSEYKIRKTLALLTSQGLAAAAPGRYGLTLTDKGDALLQKRSKSQKNSDHPKS